MSKEIYNNYNDILDNPNLNNYKNVIYDNLTNVDSHGLNGKYGSQIVLLTFLNKDGSIEEDKIEERTFTMILREPFKLSLSMKQPSDSPYVSMVKEFQSQNKKRCSYSSVNFDTKKLNYTELAKSQSLFDPINLTDDYSIKMYSGTEHPIFTLNGRIYMDRTIFRPIQENINDNYEYTINLLTNILKCILPEKVNDEKTIKQFAEKFNTGVITQAFDSAGFLKYMVGGEFAAGVAINGLSDYSKHITNMSEGTYGTNLVSFSIPWLFGNIATFGSTNVNTKDKTDENGNVVKDDNGNNVKIKYGNTLKTKCFIKHFDYKLSKEYYVEKIIKNGIERITRYPSYIDINLTLESTQIPSFNTWKNNWLKEFPE